jgi:hypothetical protein
MIRCICRCLPRLGCHRLGSGLGFGWIRSRRGLLRFLGLLCGCRRWRRCRRCPATHVASVSFPQRRCFGMGAWLGGGSSFLVFVVPTCRARTSLQQPMKQGNGVDQSRVVEDRATAHRPVATAQCPCARTPTSCNNALSGKCPPHARPAEPTPQNATVSTVRLGALEQEVGTGFMMIPSSFQKSQSISDQE